MGSSLSREDHEAQVDALWQQVLAFLEFLAQHLSSVALAGYRERAERVYATGSLAKLRQVRDGLLEPIEAGAVGVAEERRLDALLRERTGTSLDELLSRRLARIAKLREKGRITTRAQYDLVKERVEFIWSDPARAEEFRSLQELCTSYEEHELRRARQRRKDPDAAA
jgi:hypothetical protein